MRKKIQEKHIKFATRVSVFLYLTDYRERSLKDVLTQLEPGLFKKVTGLDVKDFEPEEPALYNSPDVKEGSIVVHKRFGEGTVTKMDKAQKHIRVKFSTGEKTFIFPDAFKWDFLRTK